MQLSQRARRALRRSTAGVLTALLAASVALAAPPQEADALDALRTGLTRELSARLSNGGAPPPSLPSALSDGPVYFEPARARADGSRRFAVRGAGHGDVLETDGITLAVGGSSASRTVHLRMLDANPAAMLVGEQPLQARSHYFLGRNADGWRTDVPRYGRVRYQEVYPGIDLIVYGHGTDLEYDFAVAPGADPGRIRLTLGGGGEVELAGDGALVLQADDRELRMQPPVVYQEGATGRTAVSGRYALLAEDPNGRRAVGFELGPYDRDRPLMIDPILSFGTYWGGSDHDIAHDVAVDSDGFVYVVGRTASLDFPLVAPLPPTPGASYSAFITKLDPTGSEVIYSTYLGGSAVIFGFEQMAVAVDPEGYVYVTGETSDPNFPVVNARWPSLAGDRDAFVVKLDPTGSQIVYSTYVGGSSIDLGRAIAAEAEGIAYVLGITLSPDFPVFAAPQPNLNGVSDAFLIKFSADGSFVYYSTYLGGSGREFGYDLVSDHNKNSLLYATGFTESVDFPTTSGAYLEQAPSGANAFVVKIRGSDGERIWSTYLGGSANEEGLGIAVDRQGRAHVAGWTQSSDFPVQGPVQASNAGGFDAWVARLSEDGSDLEFASYLGGEGTDFAYAVGVNDDGAIDVAGNTASATFPTQVPIDATLSGNDDAFLARVDPAAGTLRHSTYLGGGGIESILGMSLGLALDEHANAFLALMTTSANFPTRGPVQATQAGGLDAGIVKVGDRPEVIVRAREVGGLIDVDLVLANGAEVPTALELRVFAGRSATDADLGLISLPLTLPARLQPVKLGFSLPALFDPATSRVGARMTDAITGAPLSESLCPALPCR